MRLTSLLPGTAIAGAKVMATALDQPCQSEHGQICAGFYYMWCRSPEQRMSRCRPLRWALAVAGIPTRGLGVFDGFPELLHCAVVLIGSQGVPCGEDDGHRPLEDTEHTKRPDSGVVGEPLRFGKADRTQQREL